MHKIVTNECFGGFGLSDIAVGEWERTTGLEWDAYEVARHDPTLIAIVERLGYEANTDCSHLVVREVNAPRYYISEYDGMETIVTPQIVEQMWIYP
jgi:hypothetical protein